MNGASRATACFSFDNLGEAAEIGAGELAAPLPAGTHASLAVGYPALFALLERRNLRSTFFVGSGTGSAESSARV